MNEHYVLYYQNLTRSGTTKRQPESWINIATLRLIFLGLAPLSLLAFLNVRVYSAIQSNSNLRQRTYSVILLLIVSFFIICQLPRIVILQTFFNSDESGQRTLTGTYL